MRSLVVMRTAYLGQPHSKEGYILKKEVKKSHGCFVSVIMYSFQGDMDIFGDISVDLSHCASGIDPQRRGDALLYWISMLEWLYKYYWTNL